MGHSEVLNDPCPTHTTRLWDRASFSLSCSCSTLAFPLLSPPSLFSLYFFSFSSLFFSFLFFSSFFFYFSVSPSTELGIRPGTRTPVKGKRCTELLCRSSFEKVSPPFRNARRYSWSSFRHRMRICNWRWLVRDKVFFSIFSRRYGRNMKEEIYENTCKRKRLEGKHV